MEDWSVQSLPESRDSPKLPGTDGLFHQAHRYPGVASASVMDKLLGLKADCNFSFFPPCYSPAISQEAIFPPFQCQPAISNPPSNHKSHFPISSQRTPHPPSPVPRPPSPNLLLQLLPHQIHLRAAAWKRNPGNQKPPHQLRLSAPPIAR